MDLIQIFDNEYLLVEVASGAKVEDTISAAMRFCKEFALKGVVFDHNNRLIQVTSRGLVKAEIPEPKGPP